MIRSSKNSIYSAGFIWYSDVMNQNTGWISLPSLSTPLFDHRVYGSVKWCEKCRSFAALPTLLFFKCVWPSGSSILVTSKAAHESNDVVAATSADFCTVEKNLTWFKWSSRRMRTYFSAFVANKISIWSNLKMSFLFHWWQAQTDAVLFSPLFLDRHWMYAVVRYLMSKYIMRPI